MLARLVCSTLVACLVLMCLLFWALVAGVVIGVAHAVLTGMGVL